MIGGFKCENRVGLCDIFQQIPGIEVNDGVELLIGTVDISFVVHECILSQIKLSQV